MNSTLIDYVLQARRDCHARDVWPDGWDGDAPTGDLPFEDGGQLLIESLVRRA